LTRRKKSQAVNVTKYRMIFHLHNRVLGTNLSVEQLPGWVGGSFYRKQTRACLDLYIEW